MANTVEGSGPGARVRITMESTAGGLAFAQQPAPQTVIVDENGEGTLNFRMRAQDTLGEAAVRFTATVEDSKATKSGVENPSCAYPDGLHPPPHAENAHRNRYAVARPRKHRHKAHAVSL